MTAGRIGDVISCALLLAFGVALVLALAGCSGWLGNSPEVDDVNIGTCQIIGRACAAADAGDCFKKYRDCMTDAGL